MNLSQKLKYNNDVQFRQKKRQTVQLNYVRTATDSTLYKHFKEIKRKQYLRNVTELQMRARQRKKDHEQRLQWIENTKRRFQTAVQEYPEYICSVCHRLLFRKQVQVCNKTKYDTSVNTHRLATTCINGDTVHTCRKACRNNCPVQRKSRINLYICHTCDRYLRNGKMPLEAYRNGLQLQPVPCELETLNILEKHLISKIVPFMKLITLPKGGQKKLKGPCIMVPSDLQNTINVLPRCDTDNPQIIKLKLKRKLTYEGYYEYKQVDLKKVHDALRCLKDKVRNVHYENVEIDNSSHSFLGQLDSSAIDVQTEKVVNDSHNEEVEETSEDCDETEGAEDENRIGPILDTFLMPVNMVQEALPLCPDSILSIAPCEKNKPTNLFANKACEALAFPNHFPDGRNTLTEERQLKLSPSKYFQARLMNVDNRFAKDPQYIFFSLYITELQFIFSNISIALRKGKKQTKDGTKITAGTLSQRQGIDHVTGEDTGFRHFPTLKGSPDYWRRMQHDLFAMIRQLGIPTFFCTFSCNNDWAEIVTAIKAQQGETVDVDTLSWEEKCNILASNPVTCARMFDHRVKLFLHQVIRSPPKPIGEVIDWFYRVEWQARGSPHIHCLFWVKDAPVLGRHSDQAVCDFVDQYILCQASQEDLHLHEKVTRYQTHSKRHTKSCKKGNRPCRFNFPKPVAKETFVSRPATMPDGRAPSKAEIEHAGKQLSTVRDLLNENESDEQISIDDLLEKVRMTWEAYKNCFHVATKKVSLVHKREFKDCWTNYYNSALLDSTLTHTAALCTFCHTSAKLNMPCPRFYVRHNENSRKAILT